MELRRGGTLCCLVALLTTTTSAVGQEPTTVSTEEPKQVDSYIAYEKEISFKSSPYEMKLGCGFENGSEIIIKGALHHDTDRLQLRICEQNSDGTCTKCPLYADVWLNNNTVDLKTYFGGVWNKATRFRKLPLIRGRPFNITIRSGIKKYVIYMNDIKCAQFNHDVHAYGNTVVQVSHAPVVDTITYSFPEKGGSLTSSCKDWNSATEVDDQTSYKKKRRKFWRPTVGLMIHPAGATKASRKELYSSGWGHSTVHAPGWGQSHGLGPGWDSPQPPTPRQSHPSLSCQSTTEAPHDVVRSTSKPNPSRWGESNGQTPVWEQPPAQVSRWNRAPGWSQLRQVETPHWLDTAARARVGRQRGSLNAPAPAPIRVPDNW